MNRFKKELRKIGMVLESDLPMVPFERKDGVSIEGITVDSVNCTVTTYYNVMTVKETLNRQMCRTTT